MFSAFPRQADPDMPLVEAARKGDIHAFDILVRRYQARLTLFVRARLDTAIDADDVAQEIFVTAWCQLAKFRGKSRFKTWLFGIALNHCAEAMRKSRHVKLVLVDGTEELDGEQPWVSQADPRDWPAVLAEREAIRVSLDTLAEPDRQVMELYYYAQLNLPEIATLLELNLNTLKYRFYQAHRRMRRSMETMDAREAAPVRTPTPLRAEAVPVTPGRRR